MTDCDNPQGRLWPPALASVLSLQTGDRLALSLSVLMLRSVRALAPSFALFAGTVGFGLCTATYGSRIALAPSAREAAPFAVPFALFASAAAASFALAAAASCDAAEKLSRSRLS